MLVLLKDITKYENNIHWRYSWPSNLEGTVQRKFRQTRKQYMQNLIDLGHGYDDPQGKVFTQSLSEHFNIGIVNGNSLKKCNIHEVSQYSKYRNEMGD